MSANRRGRGGKNTLLECYEKWSEIIAKEREAQEQKEAEKPKEPLPVLTPENLAPSVNSDDEWVPTPVRKKTGGKKFWNASGGESSSSKKPKEVELDPFNPCFSRLRTAGPKPVPVKTESKMPAKKPKKVRPALPESEMIGPITNWIKEETVAELEAFMRGLREEERKKRMR